MHDYQPPRSSSSCRVTPKSDESPRDHIPKREFLKGARNDILLFFVASWRSFGDEVENRGDQWGIGSCRREVPIGLWNSELLNRK